MRTIICDQCREDFGETVPHWTLTPFYRMLEMPDEYHFCSVGCLEKWAHGQVSG